MIKHHAVRKSHPHNRSSLWKTVCSFRPDGRSEHATLLSLIKEWRSDTSKKTIQGKTY